MRILPPGRARRAAARLALAAPLTLLAAPAVLANPSLVGTTGCDAIVDRQAPALPWLLPGQPLHRVQIALQALADAGSHGLDPRHYDAQGLAAQALEMSQPYYRDASPWNGLPSQYARFNRRMTDAVTCYLGHVRDGVLDRALAHPHGEAPPRWQAGPALRQAWTNDTLEGLLRDAAPSHPAYAHLRTALARVRALHEAGVSALRADDDVQPEHIADPAPDRADRALVARIELAMERHRWLTRGYDERIIVNLPAYELTYLVADQERLSSRVVVGGRNGARTPLLEGEMERVEISPLWYVPPSIAQRQLLPKLRKNADYLRENRMRVVWRDRTRTTEIDDRVIDAIARNRARIEQLPGDDNALGPVKFVLPNRDAIYLHGTNKPELFAQARRDRSSGCIRVEHAVELARLLLDDHARYSPTWFENALRRDRPTWIKPNPPVMVSFAYATVSADARGRITLHEDIYGWDDRALQLQPRWQVALGVDLTPLDVREL